MRALEEKNRDLSQLVDEMKDSANKAETKYVYKSSNTHLNPFYKSLSFNNPRLVGASAEASKHIEETLEKQREEVKRQADENEALSRRLSELEAQKGDVSRERDELKQTVERLETSLRELNDRASESSDIKRRADELAEQVAALEAKLRDSEKDRDGEISTLRSQVEQSSNFLKVTFSIYFK